MTQRMSLITRFTTVAVLSLAAIHAQADAKQDLIKRLPSLQKQELDALASDLAQGPARQIMAQAQNVLLQAVPAEKREATAKQVTAELTKFVETATPFVKASANKVATDAIAPVMASKFTEDELKQLVTMLESPIIKKYQELLPELNQALLEKISADVRPQFEPKVQGLQENVRKILDTASGGKLSQAAAAQAKAAAANKAPASKK
jgi:predicted RNA-binding protein with PIN domain